MANIIGTVPLDNKNYELRINFDYEAFPSCCGLGIVHNFVPRIVNKSEILAWHPAFPYVSRLTDDDKKRVVDWFRRKLINIGCDEHWNRLIFTDASGRHNCVSLSWLGEQLECEKSHTFYNPNSGNNVDCFFFETHYEDVEDEEDEDGDWD